MGKKITPLDKNKFGKIGESFACFIIFKNTKNITISPNKIRSADSLMLIVLIYSYLTV